MYLRYADNNSKLLLPSVSWRGISTQDVLDVAVYLAKRDGRVIEVVYENVIPKLTPPDMRDKKK